MQWFSDTFCRFSFGLIAITSSVVLPVQAQLALPQASPLAHVSQIVGLTKISVAYHAPGVKGRQIWGKLVPYGQVWRAGANQSTRVRFEDDVLVGGQRVPAGQYAFYALPTDSANAFVIFNRDTARWGTDGYNPQADVFRVPVKMTETPFHETLQYSFSNVRPTSVSLDLAWERRRLTVPIEVEVLPKAVANIRAAAAKASPTDWLLLTQAAEYLVRADTEHELALELVNRAIAIEQNYYNTWVKARLLAQKDEYKTAIQLTRAAMQLGEKTPKDAVPAVTAYPVLAPDMKLAVAQWKIKQ
jgi:tetratricopeptide (TPR) repeat protein